MRERARDKGYAVGDIAEITGLAEEEILEL